MKVSLPYFHIVGDEKEADVRSLVRELERFRVVAQTDDQLENAADLFDKAVSISSENSWISTAEGYVSRAHSYKVKDRSTKGYLGFVNTATKAYGKAINGGGINIEDLIEISYFYSELGKYQLAFQLADVASLYSPHNYRMRK